MPLDKIRNFIERERNTVLYEGLPVPEITIEDICAGRESCKENKCGFYGKNGTCPPAVGSPKECLERVHRYGHAAMLVQTIEDIDTGDREETFPLTSMFQNTCRILMQMLRQDGRDVLALAGGPCTYCETCDNLDGRNCKHPEFQVPSMSGFGINVREYAERTGLGFSFEKDRMNLYGIFLFNDDETLS